MLLHFVIFCKLVFFILFLMQSFYYYFIIASFSYSWWLQGGFFTLIFKFAHVHNVMLSDFLIFSILNRSVIRYTSVGCISLFLRFIIFTIFVRFSIISLNHFSSLYMRTSLSDIFSYWEFLQNSLAIIFWMVCFSVFLSTYTEITLEKYFSSFLFHF